MVEDARGEKEGERTGEMELDGVSHKTQLMLSDVNEWIRNPVTGGGAN